MTFFYYTVEEKSEHDPFIQCIQFASLSSRFHVFFLNSARLHGLRVYGIEILSEAYTFALQCDY